MHAVLVVHGSNYDVAGRSKHKKKRKKNYEHTRKIKKKYFDFKSNNLKVKVELEIIIYDVKYSRDRPGIAYYKIKYEKR